MKLWAFKSIRIGNPPDLCLITPKLNLIAAFLDPYTMTSTCSICGRSYKNLRAHEVKKHERVEISQAFDSEGDWNVNIEYIYGNNKCIAELSDHYNGGKNEILTYWFKNEDVHPRYAGLIVCLQTPKDGETYDLTQVQLYYASATQLCGGDALDTERLCKVRNDRVKILISA